MSEKVNQENSEGAAAVVNKNERSCRPITIKQVKKIKLKNEDQYLLDQHEITNVTVIGVVRAIVKQDTHTSYTIEDGTGAMEIKYWYSPEDSGLDSHKEVHVQHDTYIRVIGRLRSFNQHTSLIAAFIRSLDNPNEITFHFLNVIYTYLRTRTSLDTYVSKGALRENTKNVVKRVIQLHAHSDSKNGVKIQSIVSHLKNTMDEAKVMEAIENLSLEGKIYNATEDSIKLVE